MMEHSNFGERDEVLVERVKQHDRAAFDVLVRRYREKLYGYALKMLRNEEEAKDASQEALIRSYMAIRHFKGRAQFSTWLFQILVNHCRDRLRKQARKRRVIFEPTSAEDGKSEEGNFLEAQADPKESWNPARGILIAELRNAIQQALEGLPPRQKEVFVLKHYDGLKLEEIAHVLKRPVGTVKANLFKAVQSMRRMLEPVWGVSRGIV